METVEFTEVDIPEDGGEVLVAEGETYVVTDTAEGDPDIPLEGKLFTLCIKVAILKNSESLMMVFLPKSNKILLLIICLLHNKLNFYLCTCITFDK